jgi:hypothetical protein
MMFLLKSWRICTIDRLAPKAEACARSAPKVMVGAGRLPLAAN